MKEKLKNDSNLDFSELTEWLGVQDRENEEQQV